MGTEGMPRVARKSNIKALQIHMAVLWKQGGGHTTQFFAGILSRQPVGLIDFFLIIIIIL